MNRGPSSGAVITAGAQIDRKKSSMTDARYEDAQDPAVALFQQQWRVYRKVIDQNYIQHREVYARLHQVLVEEATQPFRFLDIACGDATASPGALLGTRVASYHGIDLSGPALDLARESLHPLDCPVTLEQRDFAAALRDRTEAGGRRLDRPIA